MADPREEISPFPEPDPLRPVVIPLPSDLPPMMVGEVGLPAIAPLSYSGFPNITDPQEGMGLEGQDRLDEVRKVQRLTGSFDGFVGKVLKTYYGSTHPTIGIEQAIDVERVDVRWDSSTNKPLSTITPSPMAGSTNIVACKPWPGFHDQPAYHVAEGDIVTIIRGADGLSWFMTDDSTFIGKVVVWDDAKVTEDFSGGVDHETTDSGLKVRQQAITGDPTSEIATLADLTTIADAWDSETAYIIDDIAVNDDKTYRCIEAHTDEEPASATYWEEDNIVIHRYVNVLMADNMAHGYRVGDDVLVVRRGLYLFCLPLRETFLARVNLGAKSGPDDEDDFTDEHYWVREVDPTITLDTNKWTFTSDPAPIRPFAVEDDPTGSGGRLGRWVDAANLTERDFETHLLVDDTLVSVTMHASATREPFYTFTHAANALELCKPKTTPTGTGATITVRPYDYSGNEITSQADVVLRCATDGSSVNFKFRAWTTSTLLVFQRFPVALSGVHGIITGAAPDELPSGGTHRMPLVLDSDAMPEWEWLEAYGS